MKTYNNSISQNIYNILSPLIGDIMAQGVLKSQSEKIGATDESISVAHLPKLSEEIRKGLVLFLGSDKAKLIAQRITELH
jgi:hypothetical protein